MTRVFRLMRMTKRSGAERIGGLIVPALLTLALTLAGCSNASGGEAAGPPPSPLLYEIARADGTVEGWMVGTIHALPPDTRWRTPAIDQVVEKADLLVVEIGKAKGRDQGPAIYSSLAQSPGLPPLDQRLPPDLRPQLAALMARGGVDVSDFAADETWAAAIALARIDATGDTAHGVDRALIADFAARPVRELEGLRGQLSIFDRLSEGDQRGMLAAVVRESERGRKDPERLQRAWLAGDAATIEQSTHEGLLAEPGLREALLVGRNRAWIAVLAPMLDRPPRPLIAVGAAHLVGPDGLVALFEAQGYSVTRVPRSVPKSVAKPTRPL